MTAEQKFHLHRLAEVLVTRERFGRCPDGNPDCQHPIMPRGYGYHAECFGGISGIAHDGRGFAGERVEYVRISPVLPPVPLNAVNAFECATWNP